MIAKLFRCAAPLIRRPSRQAPPDEDIPQGNIMYFIDSTRPMAGRDAFVTETLAPGDTAGVCKIHEHFAQIICFTDRKYMLDN